MYNKVFRVLSVVCLCLIVGCSIVQRVDPIPVKEIAEICIKNNKDVLMEGFLPELVSQIRARDIQTRVFLDERPADCRFHMEYTANWGWDLAMYLTFADMRVYEDGHLIGHAMYDARGGSFRFDKFGTTAERLKVLTEELFSEIT